MDEPDNAFDFNSLLMTYQYVDDSIEDVIDLVNLLLTKYFGTSNYYDNLEFTINVMEEIGSCFKCINSQNIKIRRCGILEDFCSFTTWKAIFNENIDVDRRELALKISGDNVYIVQLFRDIVNDTENINMEQINNFLRNATGSMFVTNISISIDYPYSLEFTSFHTCINLIRINGRIIEDIKQDINRIFSNTSSLEKQTKIDEEIKGKIIANVFSEIQGNEAATIGGGGEHKKSKTKHHTNKQSKKPKLNNPLLNNIMGMRNTGKSKHGKKNHNKKSKRN
jgi:hypothetical protein